MGEEVIGGAMPSGRLGGELASRARFELRSRVRDHGRRVVHGGRKTPEYRTSICCWVSRRRHGYLARDMADGPSGSETRRRRRRRRVGRCRFSVGRCRLGRKWVVGKSPTCAGPRPPAAAPLSGKISSMEQKSRRRTGRRRNGEMRHRRQADLCDWGVEVEVHQPPTNATTEAKPP
jgi:hypothetical protein